MTFRQTSKFTFENGFGTQTLDFIVSDEYHGLTNPDQFIPTDVFLLGEIEEKTSNANGALVQDEVAFVVDETIADTQNDKDAIAFVRQSIDPKITIFVSIYRNTGQVPDINDRMFTGIIQPTQSITDVFHKNKTAYSNEPDPLQEISFTATPISEAIFDLYTLEKLSKGFTDVDNPSNNVPGFDSDWYDANVKDRPGYFQNNIAIHIEEQEIQLMACDLVNLNHVLRKYADNLETALQTKGIGNFTINFNRCKLDGEYIPTRPAIATLKGGINIPTGFARGDGLVKLDTPWRVKYFDDERFPLFLDPDGKPADYEENADGIPVNANTETWFKESVWIDYKLINNRYYDIEPNFELAEQFLWYNQVETFTDLLYGLCRNLGLYIKLYFTEPTNLQVEFINNSEFVGDSVWIEDATDVSEDIEAVADDNDVKGYASYYSHEGGWNYYVDNSSDVPIYDRIELSKKKLLLTLSQTFKRVFKSGLFNNYLHDRYSQLAPMRNHEMLHNHTFRDKNGNATGVKFQSRSVHTGIYMYVDKRPDNNNAPASYFVPAGWLTVKIDGEDKSFSFLSKYLDNIYSNTREYYAYKKTIEVPSWNGFMNESGVKSWKNVNIGSKVHYNGVDYVVVGIKKNLSEPKTTLDLIANTKFNRYALVDATPEIILQEDSTSEDNNYDGKIESSYVGKYQMIGSGIKGNVVALVNGQYLKAQPISDHCNKIFGVALSDWYDGQYIDIQRTGDFDIFDLNIPIDGWDGIQVDRLLFLRISPDGHNISITPLLDPTPDEQLWAAVGKKISEDTMQIDFSNQGILE